MKKIFLMLCVLSSISFSREVIITPSGSLNYGLVYHKTDFLINGPKTEHLYNYRRDYISTFPSRTSIEMELDVKTPVYKKDKFSVLLGGNFYTGISILTRTFNHDRFLYTHIATGPNIGVGPLVEFKYDINKNLNIFADTSINVGGFIAGKDFAFAKSIDTPFYGQTKTMKALTLSPTIKLGGSYKNWVVAIKVGTTSWFSKKEQGYHLTMGNVGLNIGYNFVLNKDNHKMMPEVKEVMPEIKEVAPEVKEVMPEVKEVAPEVKEVMPEVKEVAPEVKEVMPEVKEIVPENCSLEELKCTLNGFNVNDKNLTEDAQNKVDEVVSFLNNHVKEGSLKIYGYTDNSGKERYNQRLSAERAQSVSELLRAKGLNPEIKFETISGKGEMDPVDSNNTSMGRFNNRRVSIYFMK